MKAFGKNKLTPALAALLATSSTIVPTSLALDNGLAKTPQMGWNSWNKFACDVSEVLIKQTADRIVELGLDKLGYSYVNIDDCWMEVNRTADGHMQPDRETFPNGIKHLADYVHDKGLKLGVYSSAGYQTCEFRAGSLGHERVDAQDWADWGVDYLKYDNCHNEGLPGEIRYPAMRDALLATSRPILYSICSWGTDEVSVWGNITGNSWRTTEDIQNNWESMKENYLVNDQLADSAGPGAWNDPDMLEVGNGGMSEEEEKTHFALWAVAKAPLIIGCDLSTVSNSSLAILSNKNIIKLNQDSRGEQARCAIGCDKDQRVYKSRNSDDGGYYALVAVNFNDTEAYQETIDFVGTGLANVQGTSCKVTDLWTSQVVGTFVDNYTTPSIPAHGSHTIRIDC